eukprot:g61876.t1
MHAETTVPAQRQQSMEDADADALHSSHISSHHVVAQQPADTAGPAPDAGRPSTEPRPAAAGASAVRELSDLEKEQRKRKRKAKKAQRLLATLQAVGYQQDPSELLNFKSTRQSEAEEANKSVAAARKQQKRSQETQEEAERDWQDSLQQAKQLLAEERREAREWSRLKKQRRKAQGGVPAQGGQWVEGMSSIAHKGREDGMH